MPDVVALGDVNVDIIASFDAYPAKGQDALASSIEFHCGGSAANTAMALARLGFEVCLIARVGIDPLASKALHGLDEAGVLSSGLQRDPVEMTGLMYVVVTLDGERTILGHRGANALTDPGTICVGEIQCARLFHLSGYALLAEPQRSAALLALETSVQHGLVVTLDPGLSVPQTALEEAQALLPLVDLFLPNLEEAQRLTGLTDPEACARWLLDAGVGLVALKLGKDGCLVGSSEGFVNVPGFAVEARDSTGAGDYFAAGYLAGYLGGLDRRSAALLGNAMGAVAVGRLGAGTAAHAVGKVLNLVHGYCEGPVGREEGESAERVIDFLLARAEESQEEILW
jgi:ribokinase